MNVRFCTIVSPEYVPYAVTLGESVAQWTEGVELDVLVTCSRKELEAVDIPSRRGMNWVSVDDIVEDAMCSEAYGRYYHKNINAYRWASKASILRFLLRSRGADVVGYFDADIWITSECADLVEKASQSSILLTPHWHSENPEKEDSHFYRWFRTGLYNAGFLAATHAGIPALEWWHHACMCACRYREDRSVYYDQKYLDLLPVLFPGVEIICDRRYNVGGWRMDEFFGRCRGCWPLPAEERPVFLHMTCLEDVRLPGPSEPAIREYSRRLQENGLGVDLVARTLEARAAKETAKRLRASARNSPLRRMRARLRIGTRLRHLLEAFRFRPRGFGA